MSVSVVITCFNLERYIGEAIASARKALEGLSGEILVIDDGSTDGSAHVIRSNADVRYVRTAENGGVMLATLEGVRAATHRRIAFLDGDDVWHPSKLAAVEAAFTSDASIGLITHDFRYVSDRGYPTGRATAPGRSAQHIPASERGDWIRGSILSHAADVWLGSALAVDRVTARLDAFDDFVRTREEVRDLYQDWPMAMWVASQPGVRCAYVPEKLFDYRLHGDNHSGDARTFSKAVRNFRRNRNTLRAMADIALLHGTPTEALRRHLDLAEGQVALFDGEPSKAFAALARSVPTLIRSPRELAKEAIRFGALTALGPERGHQLVRRLSGHA